MELEACLPADLRGPATTITRVAAGLSGAGVYRVDAGDRAYVLKVAGEAEDWSRTLRIQRLAADAGLAPRIVHVDEVHRAVVTELVVDRSFMPLYFDPRTRAAAVDLLGRTIRAIHDLPLDDAEVRDPRGVLAAFWPELSASVPGFVTGAVRAVLADEPPAPDRAPVLSHNDVNPTNFVYDGTRLVLFDWDTAGGNDPFYDLAAIAVFLRMDDATCQELIAAHDGAPVSSLPARFVYNRRLVAVLCGAMFLRLARQAGHAGGDAALDATPGLADVYQQLRAGAVSVASADGRWAFGLALIKASLA